MKDRHESQSTNLTIFVDRPSLFHNRLWVDESVVEKKNNHAIAVRFFLRDFGNGTIASCMIAMGKPAGVGKWIFRFLHMYDGIY